MEPGPRFRIERARLRLQQLSHIPAYLSGGRLSQPVFIVSAPRSGSQLVYQILRTSKRLTSWRPSEAHEVWEAEHHPALRRWTSNVLDESDLTPQAAARIRREFFLVAGADKRLLDKTPRNALRVPFVDAVFPDARYIFLQRDGRDNVNSLINAWRSPRYRTYRLPEPHHIPGVDQAWWKFVLYPEWRSDAHGPLEVVCAKQWSIANSSILRALGHIEDSRSVRLRYEDLIERPVHEVARILDFLELPYEAAVRARAEATATTPVNVVTPPERGKWRRENPTEIEAIEPLIAPTMAILGYDGSRSGYR
ncbi:MAG: sulfotransferase [Actinomycetota bacterium]